MGAILSDDDMSRQSSPALLAAVVALFVFCGLLAAVCFALSLFN